MEEPPEEPFSQVLPVNAARWQALERELREFNRLAPENGKVVDELLESGAPQRELASGVKVFRARIPDLVNQARLPTDTELGPPPREQASGGRLNPAGIVYLYCALDAETALAEVRPWMASRVWLGSFDLMTPVQLLDLTGVLAEKWPWDERQYAGYMLARPAHQRDASAYLLSQYLGQRVHAAGYDGVAYDSLLRRGGTNIAFFDPAKTALRPRRVENRSVSDISYRADTMLWEERS